jgi:DNA repair exonuclease SbcCD ATPase subunit
LGSGRNFEKAENVMEHADPEMIAQLDEGALSVNAAYRSLKEKSDKLSDELQQRTNEYTTESAQMAVKLEKQVKKNADLEELIAALKRQGDPDLIEQIDKLEAEVRRNYELYQQTKAETDRVRRRAELAEERAAKDREKLDAAAEDNYHLLEQLEELQDKLNADDTEQLAPVVQFSGNPYTMYMLLREMSGFSDFLDKIVETQINANQKDADAFDAYLRDIVTKLGAIKNQIKEVA